jgi:hypothetical protein
MVVVLHKYFGGCEPINLLWLLFRLNFPGRFMRWKVWINRFIAVCRCSQKWLAQYFHFGVLRFFLRPPDAPLNEDQTFFKSAFTCSISLALCKTFSEMCWIEWSLWSIANRLHCSYFALVEMISFPKYPIFQSTCVFQSGTWIVSLLSDTRLHPLEWWLLALLLCSTRIPNVDVRRKMAFNISISWESRQRQCKVWVALNFFMTIHVHQQSVAPMAKSCSVAKPKCSAVISLIFVSRKTKFRSTFQRWGTSKGCSSLEVSIILSCHQGYS